VDSVLNENDIDPNAPFSQQNFNFGNLLGNIMNSLGGLNNNNAATNNNNATNNNTNNANTNSSSNPPAPSQQEEKKDSEVKATPGQEENKKEETTENKNTLPTPSPTPSPSISAPASIFQRLKENSQLRKETKIGDEKVMGHQINPNVEFAEFSNDIIANLTVQDIFDIFNFNFDFLSKLRKDINSKYFSDKEKKEEIIQKIVELLCERFILIENQIDKLIPDKEFILEDFFKKELKNILMMFIDENELNLSDEVWAAKIRKLIIQMLKDLIKEVKELYETGEEGAKTFFEFNILALIESFIGQKYLNALQDFDDNVINNYVENVFNVKEDKEENNDSTPINNVVRPSPLSIEEIFQIANKDKERWEKREDKKEDEDDKCDRCKNYKEFYNLTSLFKS